MLPKALHSWEDEGATACSWGVQGTQSAQGFFPLVALLCPGYTIPLRRLWAALRSDIIYRQTILRGDVIPSPQLISLQP